MSLEREKIATEAYLNLLKRKGCNLLLLKQREVFLSRISMFLAGKDLNGHSYRQAVEQFMENRPADQWPVELTAAREFYPFWIDDIRAISLLIEQSTIQLEPHAWVPEPISLEEVWKSIQDIKLGTTESWAIKSYSKALRNETADNDLIEKRIKLAKLILVRLRDAPSVDSHIYRLGVDATTPLFNLKDARQHFLIVVREFFYFWSGYPNASEFILQTKKVSIV